MRHKVAIMRKQIATPLKAYQVVSKNCPNMIWSALNEQQVCICGENGNRYSNNFHIVPALYQPGDETDAQDWNIGIYNTSKDTLVSFRCVHTGKYLRHANFALRWHKKENSKLYRLDALFYMSKNEFFKEEGVDYHSFHSINLEGFYISHRSFVLRIDIANDGELHRNDASFVLRLLTYFQNMVSTM